MNKVYLIGNLTRDPELRSTTSGIDVCNFNIAVNRRFKDADGKQQTDYFNIVAWKQLAGLCNRWLAKGRKVAVFGSIQTRTYEDRDGKKRTAFDIVADEVEFLSSGQGTNAQEAAYLQQERQAIQNEPAGSGYTTAVNKEAPTFSPADVGFTQVDDDELPF